MLQFSSKLRAGPGQWVAEAVATAGLMVVILRAPAGKAAALAACYIGAAGCVAAQAVGAVLGTVLAASLQPCNPSGRT